MSSGINNSSTSAVYVESFSCPYYFSSYCSGHGSCVSPLEDQNTSICLCDDNWTTLNDFNNQLGDCRVNTIVIAVFNYVNLIGSIFLCAACIIKLIQLNKSYSPSNSRSSLYNSVRARFKNLIKTPAGIIPLAILGARSITIVQSALHLFNNSRIGVNLDITIAMMFENFSFWSYAHYSGYAFIKIHLAITQMNSDYSDRVTKLYKLYKTIATISIMLLPVHITWWLILYLLPDYQSLFTRIYFASHLVQALTIGINFIYTCNSISGLLVSPENTRFLTSQQIIQREAVQKKIKVAKSAAIQICTSESATTFLMMTWVYFQGFCTYFFCSQTFFGNVACFVVLRAFNSKTSSDNEEPQKKPEINNIVLTVKSPNNVAKKENNNNKVQPITEKQEKVKTKSTDV